MTKKHFFRKMILGILATSLLTGFLLLSAFFLYMKFGIDDSLDMEALAGEQNLTTKLYYTDETGAEKEWESERLFGTENRIWIPLSEIPKQVQQAFIAIEDHRFYTHNGIDAKRTAGAVLSFFGKKSYGGSTITQQLIKNLTGDNAITVKRKLTEIKRAIALEKTVSKDRILELYLNTVYLSQGCYGIRTAAERYFSKDVGELTLEEAATLAGIIQYPTHFDPIQNPENSKNRRDTVLARMNELGMIDDAAFQEATEKPITLNVTKNRKETAVHSWFTDAVIEEVINDLCEEKGMSRSAASSLLYNGGLSIYTTVNPAMQADLESKYESGNGFPLNLAGQTADSSCVVIDSQNGNVVALVGGRGKKTSDRVFCLATQMLRSPGSVIKPVSVYAPALEDGIITWSTVFDDTPYSFMQSDKGWQPWPKNNPKVYSGLIPVNTALQNSVNTVSVKILEKLGISRSFSFCRRAGLSTLIDRKKTDSGQAMTDMALAPLALGATTNGVSVRDMTAAYTMFAADGVASRPRTYTRVTDKNGKVLLEKEPKQRQMISAENAELMTKMMQNVVASGTATNVTLGKTLPIAGKTGTSGANTDRWFIGYTPGGYVCGVWYGYRETADIGSYSDNPAGDVFNLVMTSFYEKGYLAADSERTASNNSELVSVLYCRDSGKLPCAACLLDPRGHRIELGWFVRGTEPTEKCDAHILVEYDKETKAVACPNCPKENLRQVSLVKNYTRSFPCEITVTDAQYMYRFLPNGTLPSSDQTKAFFDSLAGEKEFFGTSGKKKAFNRLCTEHAFLTPSDYHVSANP